MKREELNTYLSANNIQSSKEDIDKLFSYMDYILKCNESINLTAITNEEEFIDKMIFDSALPLCLLNLNDKKIIDVGTGGGYPGSVIATLTNQKIDMLDSTLKKLKVIDGFDCSLFNTINDRVENYAKSHREEYDIAVARSVAALPILLETIIPLVKVGGYFIAMKGKEYINEISLCKNAFEKLGCHIVEIKEHDLANGDERYNILIKKDKVTNHKYPREYSDIKKRSLWK